jgi:hypothetical protein
MQTEKPSWWEYLAQVITGVPGENYAGVPALQMEMKVPAAISGRGTRCKDRRKYPMQVQAEATGAGL